MIKLIGATYKKTEFPCGEISIEILEGRSSYSSTPVRIEWYFNSISEVFEVQLLVDAIKASQNINLTRIDMPYIPFSREDRREDDKSFSLKVFSEIVNGFDVPIETSDPHSDVTGALFNNLLVTEQCDIFYPYFLGKKDYYLISPDGGALKKIYKLAKVTDCIDVVECSKRRDVKTGEITGTAVHFDDLGGKDCYIVDDICDGGRTFIEIAKVLMQKNAGKITLVVTHGFFTKGRAVFDGYIDHIEPFSDCWQRNF